MGLFVQRSEGFSSREISATSCDTPPGSTLWCLQPSCVLSTHSFKTELAACEHMLLHVAPVLAWCSDDLLHELWCAALSHATAELRLDPAQLADALVNRGKVEALLPDTAAIKHLQVHASAYTQLLVGLGLAVFSTLPLQPDLSNQQPLTLEGISIATEVCAALLSVL